MGIRRALAVASLLAFASCGKEVGRLAFAGEGRGESIVSLTGSEVSFWTDVDIEYEGDAGLAYKIDLLQNGAPVGSVVCNPLGKMSVKTGWVETNLGSSHTRRGNGKMDCTVRLTTGGATTVRASLAFANKPDSVTIKKADLVLKQ